MKTITLAALSASVILAAEPAAPLKPAPFRTPAGNDKEMALNPGWMPKLERTSKELGQTLAFYAMAALSGEEPGKETVPDKLVFGLTWLMPLAQAEALLKPALTGSQLGTPVMVQNQCFPHRSLYLKTYMGKFQPDPQNGEVFKQAHLLLDAKMRLISVELTGNNVDATARLVPPQILVPGWVQGKGMVLPSDIEESDVAALTGGSKQWCEGTRNPYYDLLTVKANAVAGRPVIYQITRDQSKKGVTTIHITLGGMPSVMGRVSENVRWYLPAPFARVLLDIAVQNKSTFAPPK